MLLVVVIGNDFIGAVTDIPFVWIGIDAGFTQGGEFFATTLLLLRKLTIHLRLRIEVEISKRLITPPSHRRSWNRRKLIRADHFRKSCPSSSSKYRSTASFMSFSCSSTGSSGTGSATRSQIQAPLSSIPTCS